jgi:hypothetical protein
MKAIHGTIKNGQIIPDKPVTLPEGCRVRIEPDDEPLGLTEEEWPKTPEEIADWLQWFDNVEPVELTPEEEAEWKSWRDKIKAYTIATMDRGIEDLFR